MDGLKFFMDTHDSKNGTFPEGIKPEQLKEFYKQYDAACLEEGVISLRTHVAFKDGKAFCFNMAKDAEAVRRVHEKVGLPFDEIVEVVTVTPGDLAFMGCC